VGGVGVGFGSVIDGDAGIVFVSQQDATAKEVDISVFSEQLTIEMDEAGSRIAVVIGKYEEDARRNLLAVLTRSAQARSCTDIS